MVRLNGIALESIAPIKRNTVFVSPPKIKTEWFDWPISNGAQYIRSRFDVREIRIDIYLAISNTEQRLHYINLINTWATYSTPQALEFPSMPGKYIMAKVSKLPGPSTREWWEKLTLEFTAGDPFFLDYDYLVAPCGIPFEIYGNGAASAYIQDVEATSTTDPEWELDSDKTIALDGTFAAGTFKVDLDSKKVYLDDVSQMQYVTLQSRFFELEPGIHTIAGSGTIFYKQRWL